MSSTEQEDLPPKYEDCEELPPQYDEATMKPDNFYLNHDSCYDNKSFHH